MLMLDFFIIPHKIKIYYTPGGSAFLYKIKKYGIIMLRWAQLRKVVKKMSETYKPKLDVMLTYLRGRLDGMGFEQSQKALAFAIRMHNGLYRKDGSPYIIHPVAMACFAIAHKGMTDEIIATILLHDVCEDCNLKPSLLPVNETIRYAVKLMTKVPFEDETKDEERRRYFNGLSDSKEAIICKAFDRYDNLNSMEGVFEEKDVIKNIKETHEFLLPVLKKAKYEYPELSDIFHTVRTMLKNTVKMMAQYHDVKLD